MDNVKGSQCSTQSGSRQTAAPNSFRKMDEFEEVNAMGDAHRCKVIMIADGTSFPVDIALITTHPSTMLGRMFGSGIDANLTKPNQHNEYEIKFPVSATIFEILLQYYKLGYMKVPISVSVTDVREACDYFLIPFNENTIRAVNLGAMMHELSNEGAKAQFAEFIENVLISQLAQFAKKGERECHIFFLMEDDIVEWDDRHPPIGEEHSHILYSNTMSRFLKYIENREVAKKVLKDRGFKKIRIGIEGYPTHAEKVKSVAQHPQRPNHKKIEVTYHYVQRPYIDLSWEKEESKSRHVDFQCPPLNINANLAEAAADADIDQGRPLIDQHSPLEPVRYPHEAEELLQNEDPLDSST